MRSLLAALALLCLALPASAANLDIVRVWPGYRDTASFQRISEFFTGRENPGDRIIRRTHPEVRDGFYFLVRVHNPGPAFTGIRFSLQLITPTEAQPKTYAFGSSLATGSSVFELGLTGADWPDPKVHPVAWKLTVLSPDGRILAERQSYLWAYPQK